MIPVPRFAAKGSPQRVRAPWPKALLALWLALAPMAASAVEFTPPPGMNVARQELLLKERVKQIAQDLVGDKLVDVVVTVGYARTERKRAADPSKIKLPGFNRFINPVGGKEIQIDPEFVRLRQVFVFVTADLKPDVKTLQQEIENLGNFDRKKGDWVQVMAVSGSAEAGERENGGRIAAGGEKPGEAGGKQYGRRELRKRRPGGPFSEPESTAHLLRARTAYFKEDYNRALDHILRAISIEPENSQAYAMLGSLYYTINWKNLALKYWERSLDIDPENREVEDLVAELRNRE